MVVYRIYYAMVDRPSKNVSTIWKALHLWTQLMAAGSGIVCAWFFHIILQGFGRNCPLFANIEFSLLKPTSIGFNILPKNVTVNLRESTWGSDIYCQYNFSIWVISFIGALVLSTFFIWSKSGGSGDPRDSFVQPWKHVLPSFFVSICFSIATSIATYLESRGLDVFCAEFAPYINSARCNHKIDTFSLPFATRALNINDAIIVVRSCAPICVVSWISHTVTLFVRMCISPDFDVQIIKIMGIKKRRKPEFPADLEPGAELKRLISFMSLRTLFRSQSQFEMSDSKLDEKEPEKESKEHIPKHLPRPTDFKGESSNPMSETSQIIRTVSSDIKLPTSNAKIIVLPVDEEKNLGDVTRKLVQPKSAFKSITAMRTPGTPITELPLEVLEELVRKNPVPKQTRFTTEALVQNQKGGASSKLDQDTKGKDRVSSENKPLSSHVSARIPIPILKNVSLKYFKKSAEAQVKEVVPEIPQKLGTQPLSPVRDNEDLSNKKSMSPPKKSGSVDVPIQLVASPEGLPALREQGNQRPLSGTPSRTPSATPSKNLRSDETTPGMATASPSEHLRKQESEIQKPKSTDVNNTIGTPEQGPTQNEKESTQNRKRK